MTPEETDNAVYARQRETEERAAANAATNPAVRDAHFSMAERYADRAWSIEEGGSTTAAGSADDQAVRVRVISAALHDRFGTRALEVASYQAEAASGAASLTWAAIVSHLSGPLSADA